jgi:hypothetical protein
MEIERLLKIAEGETDKETIVMILSNRITHFLGDKDGTAIAIGAFETVADDILAWHKSKAN